mgnify:FL=1
MQQTTVPPVNVPPATPLLRDVTLTNDQLALLQDLVLLFGKGDHDHDVVEGTLKALADNRPHVDDDVFPSSAGDLSVTTVEDDHGSMVSVQPLPYDQDQKSLAAVTFTAGAAVRLGQRLTREGWTLFTSGGAK